MRSRVGIPAIHDRRSRPRGMRIGEAAEYLGMSVAGVRKAASEGRLPCRRTASGQRVFDREDLDAYLRRPAQTSSTRERVEAWYCRVSGSTGSCRTPPPAPISPCSRSPPEVRPPCAPRLQRGPHPPWRIPHRVVPALSSRRQPGSRRLGEQSQTCAARPRKGHPALRSDTHRPGRRPCARGSEPRQDRADPAPTSEAAPPRPEQLARTCSQSSGGDPEPCSCTTSVGVGHGQTRNAERRCG